MRDQRDCNHYWQLNHGDGERYKCSLCGMLTDIVTRELDHRWEHCLSHIKGTDPREMKEANRG